MNDHPALQALPNVREALKILERLRGQERADVEDVIEQLRDANLILGRLEAGKLDHQHKGH